MQTFVHSHKARVNPFEEVWAFDSNICWELRTRFTSIPWDTCVLIYQRTCVEKTTFSGKYIVKETNHGKELIQLGRDVPQW